MFKHLNTRIPKRIEQEKDKVSAVMIPLIKKNDGYHILFEVRSNKLSQLQVRRNISIFTSEHRSIKRKRLRSRNSLRKY